MNVDNALCELMPVLYETPVDPSQWQVFLARLSQLMEIPSGYLICSTPAAGNVCLAGGGAEFDLGALVAYNEHYGQNDPFRAGFLARPRTGVIDGNELVGRAALLKTELWNELLSPYGLHHVTMLSGECSASSIQALSLWRNSNQGQLDSPSLYLLQALVPHVQTTMRLNARLQFAHSSGSLSETALDALDIMVLLVDGRGRVQHMNSLAAKRLSTLSPISIQFGRLVAADTGDDSRLQNLIRLATEKLSRNERSPSGGSMKIRRPGMVGVLQISVIPTAERMHIAERDQYATIFIGESHSAPRLRGELLREVYKLTATEARLADCLLEGKDLRETAEQLSITWATARFHLKRVFAKTDSKRGVLAVSTLG